MRFFISILLFFCGLYPCVAQDIKSDTLRARRWMNRAFETADLVRLDSTLWYSEQAQLLYQKHQLPVLQAEANLAKAQVFLLSGKSADFTKELNKSLELCKGKSAFWVEVNVALLKGANLFMLGKYDSAALFTHDGLDLLLKQGVQNHKLTARAYGNLASVADKKGEYEKALRFARKALEIRLKLYPELNTEIATSYGVLSQALQKIGKLDSALLYQEKALTIKRQLNGEQSIAVATSYVNMATIYSDYSKYKLAYEYFEKSLKIIVKLAGPNHAYVGTLYNNMGVVAEYLGEYEKSISLKNKSLEILRLNLGSEHVELANAYNNLAATYSKRNELEKAMEYYKNAYRIYLASFGENNTVTATVGMNLGMHYINTGNHNDGLALLNKALSTFRKESSYNNEEVATCLEAISTVYLTHKNLSEAKKALWQAREIKLRIGGANTRMFMINSNLLGDLYSSVNELDSALFYYQSFLKTAKALYGDKHPETGFGHRCIGIVLYKKLLFKEALEEYHLAEKSICKSPSGLYEPPASLQTSDEALLFELMEHKIKTLFLMQTQKGKNTLYTNELEKNLDFAVRLLISMRNKAHSKEDRLNLSTSYVELAQLGIAVCQAEYVRTKSDKWLEKAYSYAELTKNNVLQAALAESNARSISGLPDSLLLQEKTFREKITVLEQRQFDYQLDSAKRELAAKTLFETQLEYEAFIRKLEKEHPNYHLLKYKSEPVSVKDLQKGLDKHTAVISYFTSATTLYTFVLTASSLTLSSQEITGKHASELAAFRNAILLKTKKLYYAFGRSLHDRLIPKLPADIKHLVVLADADLTRIPFEALLSQDVPQADKASYSELPYLVKKYSISYEFSSKNLLSHFTRTSNTYQRDFLAFAPVFKTHEEGGEELRNKPFREAIEQTQDTSSVSRSQAFMLGGLIAPIKESLPEVEKIRDLFANQGKTAQIFTFKEANEAQLKKELSLNTRFVHLATHGFVNEQKPDMSGVMLAQEENGAEDNVLFAGELYNLTLNCELITLSACETGLGKVSAGEGIVGISRALAYAGAQNSLVSLWKVADKSTSLYMVDFYQDLLSNNTQQTARLSSSVQQAKLRMIQHPEYAAPFYWSPFVLLGW